MTVDQLNEKVGDIIDECEEYGKELAEIMKMLGKSPKVIDETKQDPYLQEYALDFGHYQAFMMAKEALYKKENFGACQLIRELIGEILGQNLLEQKFIAMYSSIIKRMPDFQIFLSDDQVFSIFAPV